MKTCITCKTEKPKKEFHYDGYNKRYRSYCKLCDHARVKKYQHDNKEKAIEYKGGKCVICGYDKYVGALDFHHLDPSKKDFNLSQFSVYNLEKIKPELDECVILCSNCHREVHAASLY